MTAPVIPSDPIQDPPADPPAPAPVAPAPPQPGAWREGLSEGLRANPVLERFDTLEDLGNEHVNLQKHIGTEKVSKPQPNWGDEDYAGFYKALGRPDAPEGYDLSGFAPPEGVPWDDEFQGRMVEHLHKAGLNQRQLGEVLASYSQEIAGQAQEADRVANAQAAATEAGLHEKWGKAYAENMDRAKRALRHFAGEDYEQLGNLPLAKGGLLGNDLFFVSLFARLGEEMGEAGLIGQRGAPVGFTPEQATAERNKLMADEPFLKALLGRDHPEHAAAVKRMDDLTKAEMGAEGDRVVT